jgi:ssDNA-binding Zn-finger/Zn-ribbon topoisomerase 1
MSRMCPDCGSTSYHKVGSANRPDRFRCKRCGREWTDRNHRPHHKPFTGPGAPKVLVFDIETLPIIGNFWDTGKQYISHENILEDFVVLSWSAKGLFESQTIGDILTPEEIWRRNNSIFQEEPKNHHADERIVKRMWKLLDNADVVITQNGIKFDVRKLNARFLYYRLPPPRPFHHIDTLKAAQTAFASSSHRLGYMTSWLGLTRKQDTNYSLWKRAQLGKQDALQEMYDYGINDTNILEEYYATIRAWIPNHPNFSVYTNAYVDLQDDEHACPVCQHVIHESKFKDTYRTPLGNEYDAGRCPHCGSYIRRNTKRKGSGPIVRKAG